MYDGVEPPSIIGNPLIISFSILFVPCLDVIRVVLGRARRKAHLFQPDKTHIHHKFLAMGFTPRASLILIQTISTAFIVGTVLGSFFGVDINIIFWADVLVWTALNVWFSKIINKKIVKDFHTHPLRQSKGNPCYAWNIPVPHNLGMGIIFFSRCISFSKVSFWASVRVSAGCPRGSSPPS